MNIKRVRGARFYLILLAILAAGIVIKEVAAPALVRHRLISAVQDGCKTCGLSLNRVQISLVPLALSSRGVSFSWGEPGATVIDFKAERVYVPFSLIPLFKNRLRAGRIEIKRPVVTVTEGDLSAFPAAKAGAHHTDLEIEGIEVKQGSFSYLREHPGRTGSLRVSGISASAGPAGSSARLRGKEAQGRADGLLAESGKFSLKVRARLFAEAPDADVELSVAEQDLSALNPLFGPNDGIKLRGQLIEARGSAAIRGAKLKSLVYARYRGLRIKIKKNEERSAFSAFFQTLLAPLMAGKQNADGGHYDRLGTSELERKPGETLVSFTLRGMKEAALQVSSQAR